MKLKIKHSGHLGDVIYALPTIQALLTRYSQPDCEIYFPSDKKTGLDPTMNHMGGEVMLSEPMISFINPLLRLQPFISNTFFLPERDIPVECIDFDIVRSRAFNLSAGNIVDYYQKAFGVISRNTTPWLSLGSSDDFRETRDIVIGRSQRYLNDRINYEALHSHIGSKVFLGTEREYASFARTYPGLKIEYLPVKNALEVAQLISRSRLYVGNQSFFFAIAEALKAPRLLETFEPVPNVVPSGGVCGQFLSTRGLQLMASEILRQPLDLLPERDGGYRLC